MLFTKSTIEQATIDQLKDLGYYAFDSFGCMLTSLRDKLISKLKRGEVRVKEEERML